MLLQNLYTFHIYFASCEMYFEQLSAMSYVTQNVFMRNIFFAFNANMATAFEHCMHNTSIRLRSYNVFVLTMVI
jgi:hypothetical protein